MTEQLNTHTLSQSPLPFSTLFLVPCHRSREKQGVYSLSKISLNCSALQNLCPVPEGQTPAGKTRLGSWKGEGRGHHVTWQPSLKLEFLTYERFTIFILSRTSSTMTIVSQSMQPIARTDCVFLVLSHFQLLQTFFPLGGQDVI